MVRLVFAVAVVVYLWVGSLFDHTAHDVVGDRDVFAYGPAGLVWTLGFNVIPLGAAWFLWRVKKDRLAAGIFLACLPLFALFLLPQVLMERVEVTPTHLVHRREPPHDRYDADLAFDEIASAVEERRETGSFSTEYTSGYVLTLKDGRVVELPANTVLTAARDTVDARLRARGIPVRTETVPRQGR